MLACLDLSHAELSIALTDDEEIHELNRIFRKRDKPTDVLAFAMREGEGPPAAPIGDAAHDAAEMLGDVVVSVDTARRQAASRGHPLETEVRELLAHDLLHLIGYDHQTRDEARVMGAETRRLCRAAVRGRRAITR